MKVAMHWVGSFGKYGPSLNVGFVLLIVFFYLIFIYFILVNVSPI